jgi:ATP-dependent Clp protease ATP-binding subunit ClpA
LQYTLSEALKLSHRYIGAEHMLLAVIRDRDGIAGQVLREHGADLTAARGFVAGLVETDGPPAGMPAELAAPKPSRHPSGRRIWRRGRER